ncbi:hypothetical protein KR067_000036, partial [Drosophila pandora]
MTDKLLLATILCLMGTSALAQQAILEGNYNVTAFCNSVATGTQLGSIVSCEYYYVCQSTGPVQVNCTAGYAYNYTVQACQPANQANCFYGLDNPCSATSGKSFAPVSGSCNKYYACENGSSVGIGSCPVNTKFDSVSRDCIWGSCSTTQALTDTPNLNSLCEVVPPNIFFGTTESCDTWNYCTPGKADPSTSTCAYPTSCFNVQKQICDYTGPTVCNRVTDQPLISTTTGACTSNSEPKGSSTICSQYYKCQNQQWQTYNCGYGQYWDTTTQQCQARQTATPEAGCNRCEYASKQFVNAVDSGNCTNYYYCNNGVATNLWCNSGMFFSEQKQGCVNDDTLSTYVLTNGACKGATATAGASTTESDSTGST